MTDLERQILQWFADAPLGPAIMGTWWVFPTLESLHFIALCFLFGSLLLVDLRMIGFLRGGKAGSTFTYLWVTLGAFTVLALTGAGFFFTNPFNYWLNPAFKLKMGLIALAGINAGIFTMFEHRKVTAMEPDAETDGLTRTTAALSLILWTLILFAGRSLPLFDTGQG